MDNRCHVCNDAAEFGNLEDRNIKRCYKHSLATDVNLVAVLDYYPELPRTQTVTRSGRVSKSPKKVKVDSNVTLADYSDKQILRAHRRDMRLRQDAEAGEIDCSDDDACDCGPDGCPDPDTDDDEVHTDEYSEGDDDESESCSDTDELSDSDIDDELMEALQSITKRKLTKKTK